MTQIIETSPIPTPPPPIIDRFRGHYAFLSNFYPCQVTYEGLVYPSVEHAYQSAKTLSADIRSLFTNTNMTPTQAKMRGRSLAIRPNWDFLKDNIMSELLRSKFFKYPFSNMLSLTKNSTLIHGNDHHDTYWGICNGQCSRGPHKEEGQNKLGKLLMEVREEVKRRSKNDNTTTD